MSLSETQPREALDLIAEANRQMAERAKPPGWYNWALAGLLGGLLAVQELPFPFVIGYELMAAAGVGLLIAAYRRHTGMWIPGYRAGRTRWVAISAAAIFVVIDLGCVWLKREMGLNGVCFAGGLLLAALTFVKCRAWMAAYRRDLGLA
jgi:hypothetical protein